MKYIALMIAKLTAFFGRILKRGSSLPGKIAMKIDPKILSKIDFPEETAFITGTNGKTSTSFFASRILKECGKNVVTNAEGANMMQGIITAVLKSTDFSFKLKADSCVFEVDEATLPNVLRYVKPKYIGITNLFPDQEDRFGSVDKLAQLLDGCLPEGVRLILNADDPRLVKIGRNHNQNEVVYFSIEQSGFDEPVDASVKCPECSRELVFEYQLYEHLGRFHCECGFETPVAKYAAKKVDLENRLFELNGVEIELPYDKIYFVHNCVLAAAIALEMGADGNAINSALSDAKVGMGRMENIKIGGREVNINMAKNVAGFNQSISDAVKRMKDGYILCISVNNRVADGKNTDWLNRVSFKTLEKNPPERYIVSGEAVNHIEEVLIENGVNPADIVRIETARIVEMLSKEEADAYIIANYTAMTEILTDVKK